MKCGYTECRYAECYGAFVPTDDQEIEFPSKDRRDGAIKLLTDVNKFAP
jgi:hypothetical protein